jgi:hypothetical protein
MTAATITGIDHHGSVDLRPYLRAHGFLRVEHPPALWAVGCDDVALIRLTGELISAALVRGTELEQVGLLASNVVVTEPGVPAPGEYVALTVEGAGDWGPEITWDPATAPAGSLLSADVDAAARVLGVTWAYTRAGPAGGSVTVFLLRLAS